ncbi:MAG: CDP-alcohol phosphatidyltransferase family protein, partial [Opitutales bacterium]
MFTTIGLCAGLTGMRFAMEGEWEKAVFSILVAAAFDTVDGLSARLLNAHSRFGAELDSLADTISFGVAPAVVIYLWIRHPLIGSGSEHLLG